jgi:hypothetical protein
MNGETKEKIICKHCGKVIDCNVKITGMSVVCPFCKRPI